MYFLHQTQFSNFLWYNKFMNMHTFFHIAENEKDNKTNPLYKIRPFLMHFYLWWCYYYKLSQLLAIDECMIKFELGFKQYIKNKLVKWGIKCYLLCNSINGYCYKASIYYGKEWGIVSWSKIINITVNIRKYGQP